MPSKADRLSSARPSRKLSPIWLGESRDFAEVGRRFGPAPGEEQVYPARNEQIAQLASVDTAGLTEVERLGGEPVGVR